MTERLKVSIGERFVFKAADFPHNTAPGSRGVWPMKDWNPCVEVRDEMGPVPGEPAAVLEKGAPEHSPPPEAKGETGTPSEPQQSVGYLDGQVSRRT